MNESKEKEGIPQKPMSENIWGWRWSWVSLGIIIVGSLFVIFIGPKKVPENDFTAPNTIDTVKMSPQNEN